MAEFFDEIIDLYKGESEPVFELVPVDENANEYKLVLKNNISQAGTLYAKSNIATDVNINDVTSGDKIVTPKSLLDLKGKWVPIDSGTTVAVATSVPITLPSDYDEFRILLACEFVSAGKNFRLILNDTTNIDGMAIYTGDEVNDISNFELRPLVTGTPSDLTETEINIRKGVSGQRVLVEATTYTNKQYKMYADGTNTVGLNTATILTTADNFQAGFTWNLYGRKL